jgi:hypothetical protein
MVCLSLTFTGKNRCGYRPHLHALRLMKEKTTSTKVIEPVSLQAFQEDLSPRARVVLRPYSAYWVAKGAVDGHKMIAPAKAREPHEHH